MIDPNTMTAESGVSSYESDWYDKELLYPDNELVWELLDLVDTDGTHDMHPFYNQLFTKPEPIGRTSFRFKRSGIEGTIDGYEESTKLSELDNASSSNSLSLNRKHNSKSDAIKGKTSYLPFQPGGLVHNIDLQQQKDETAFLHKDEHGLFDVPQGFSRGLRLVNETGTDDIDALEQATDQKDDDDDDDVEEDKADKNISHFSGALTPEVGAVLPVDTAEIDGLVPVDYGLIRSELAKEKEPKKNWAHVVDLNHKIEDFNEVVPNMARKWPFELDTFQQEAVFHLEQGDSVFVAAHTSAGKTVVAEYAIAMASRNMTKAIYTSPIKALSNQKFRDFKETFKDIDIGLITGDVQINPEANCLIMTTEILRSMLYKGADLIRDVEYVIFDEVHYVNDIDRGVVWEEVIIMLPDHVKYILLSATVPNTLEFANWVGRTKQKDMYVISTPKRPVPLEISIWAKDKLYKVITANRKFQENEFKAHKLALEGGDKKQPPNITAGSGSRGGPGGRARGGNRMSTRGGRGNFSNAGGGRDGPNKNTWNNLVSYLKTNNLLPAVIFVFSKKRCEEYADTLSRVDFCTAKEKSEVHMFIDRAIARLKKEDRELPQILKIREMLGRGIAVHHGGLLPIVKECIEILFAKTLVKVLFATETFAMGLNLPTRTVVFDKLRKHDGKGFRNLHPGEFTQMSGRAGRRGLDATGTVIVMSYKEPLVMAGFKEVTLGTPTKLISQFRLTYNMILNLLRIEALRVEEMIKHSFSENSTQTLLPEHRSRVAKLTEELNSCHIDECTDCNLEGMKDLFNSICEYEALQGDMVEDFSKSPVLKTSALKIGRLVCYRDKDYIVKVGFVFRSDSNSNTLLVMAFDHGEEYLQTAKAEKMPYIPVREFLKKFFPKIQYKKKLTIEAVPFSSVVYVTRFCLNAHFETILRGDKDEIKKAEEQIKLVLKFQDRWEPVSLSRSKQLSLHEKVEAHKKIQKKIVENPTLFCSKFNIHYKQWLSKATIENEIESLQKLMSDENLELLPDYEQRLAVLQSLNYIDEKHNVMLKGRVACEVNSGWELVITELVLDNFLGDFEPEEIVALLSAFVYEGRTDEDATPITPRLDRGKNRILDIVERLNNVFDEHKVVLSSEEEEFINGKRFALVNVVYEWARGLSFNEIMAISSEAEGTIVRVITRLDEVCREVKNAALIIGDSTLHSKMSQAQEKIKRDIVFCGSLYL